MKVELWKIYICDGVIDISHNFKRQILEIYIPEWNISLNSVSGGVHCFRSYKGRYDPVAGAVLVKEIDLSDEIVHAVKTMVNCKEEFDQNFSNRIKEEFVRLEVSVKQKSKRLKQKKS